jgi:HD superfamily phosphohydrolase
LPLADLIAEVKTSAPSIWAEIHLLCGRWLEEPLKLSRRPRASYRIKHLNDPIWGTIELMPWEMTLLDSELVQRLRGVKQLGLAHLVFPGATHDRFSHLCGVVAAADRMVASIRRNAGHRRLAAANAAPASAPVSDFTVEDDDRYITRLAALVHDVGHGPFSHAVEPLIAMRYHTEIDGLQGVLARSFRGVSHVSVSELISVLVVLSEFFQQFLQGPIVRFGTRTPEEITRRIVASIVGGFDGSPGECLALLVSSQIDADKLDYMARDAHHAGLPIDFDSERLISKLEIAVVSRETLAPRLGDLARRADEYKHRRYNDVAIAAAGIGAFEQMLVGRTFLYDRLYHHHKVRAADAMAQRLVHYGRQSPNARPC